MKYSKQREEILGYVKSVNSHPTAEEVYGEMRKKLPNISLGTVYRNLDRLSLEKKIRRITHIGAKDRFDGNTKSHYHMICASCGKIIDLHIDYLDKLDNDIEKISNLQVLSHKAVFNILCPNCNK